jgi:hypothetical protein
MRHALRVGLWITLLAVLLAKTSSTEVAGHWEGKRRGLPLVALDVRQAGDRWKGTAVLYVLDDRGGVPVVAGKSEEQMIAPRWRHPALSFQLKRPNGGRLLDFEMKLTGANEAELRLVDDGESVVRMVRQVRQK